MKRTLILIASVVLAACAASPDQPAGVAKVQAACAADAVIRPSVTALLATPGLATPEQALAVAGARAIIDPICADPSKPLADNGAQALANATGTVLAIYTQVRAAKAASAP